MRFPPLPAWAEPRSGRTIHADDGQGQRMTQRMFIGSLNYGYDVAAQVVYVFMMRNSRKYAEQVQIGTAVNQESVRWCREGGRGLVVGCPRFNGKERDAETGLDYFLARYYSGAQGRFTSPDEFKGGIVDPFTGQDIETDTALPYADITDPQTLNKYAYVRDNPLRYVDPDGHGTDALTCAVQGAEVGGLMAGPVGVVVGGGLGALGGYFIG